MDGMSVWRVTVWGQHVQGLKNADKYLAASSDCVTASGTLAPIKTGTYGRGLRTMTQLWRSTLYTFAGSRGKIQ